MALFPPGTKVIFRGNVYFTEGETGVGEEVEASYINVHNLSTISAYAPKGAGKAGNATFSLAPTGGRD